MKNAIETRMVFDNAVRAMAKAGFDVSQYKLTQSFLRMEKQVIVGRTNFVFPILVNESDPIIFNTEQRLNLQDTFVISDVQWYLANPLSATDANFRPLTYPSPVAFTNAANASVFNVFYNGKMQISSMNNILVTAWDVERHYFSPETQATAPAASDLPLDQMDGSSYGYYPMEPNICLIGSKNNKIELILPAGVPTLTGATFARFGLRLRGILAQNSTVVN